MEKYWTIADELFFYPRTYIGKKLCDQRFIDKTCNAYMYARGKFIDYIL